MGRMYSEKCTYKNIIINGAGWLSKTQVDRTVGVSTSYASANERSE